MQEKKDLSTEEYAMLHQKSQDKKTVEEKDKDGSGWEMYFSYRNFLVNGLIAFIPAVVVVSILRELGLRGALVTMAVWLGFIYLAGFARENIGNKKNKTVSRIIVESKSEVQQSHLVKKEIKGNSINKWIWGFIVLVVLIAIVVLIFNNNQDKNVASVGTPQNGQVVPIINPEGLSAKDLSEQAIKDRQASKGMTGAPYASGIQPSAITKQLQQAAESYNKADYTQLNDEEKDSENSILLDTDKNLNNSEQIGNLYRNKKYNFRIKFPEGWKIESGDGVHIVQKASLENSTISVFIQQFDLGENEGLSSIKDVGTPKEFIDISMEGVKDKFSDVKTINYGETKIDNQPAYWVEYSASSQVLDYQLKMTSLTYFIAKGDILYSINAGTPTEEYTEIKPQFEQAVSTFVIEN